MALLSKDTYKVLRTILQIVILIAAAVLVAWQFIERGDPPVFDRENWTQRNGFTAISYGSLTRDERPGQNSRDQFSRHLAALKAAGYNWINTEDIINFYVKGSPLPEKAIYLMLEGGRKDNVIFGQNIIGPAGAHATLFTYTSTLTSWNNFFVTYSNVASIERSHFWDVGSQGVRLLRINENMPGVEPGYFISDFLRDADGKRLENDEQAFERLADYYKKSFEPLESAMATPPLAFILVPANSFGAYMPPELEAANKSLMEKYFKTAFTREGPAFNSSIDSVFQLSRMQVKPHWEAQELLAAMEKWNFHRERFDISSLDAAEDWSTFRTLVEIDDDELVLVPEEGFVDPAILRGSSLWDNVNLSVTFKERDQGERYIYLRYASRESYLRLTLRANRLLVHERLPGLGLIVVHDSVLPGRAPWNFNIQLKGSRLKIDLNGSTLEPGLMPVSELVHQGAVALGASPLPGYQAYFGRLSAEFLPTVWQNEEHGVIMPPAESWRGAITTRILPLSEVKDRAGRDNLARKLLQTGGEGNMSVAALPDGSLAFDPADLIIPPFEAAQSARLWGGVAIRPHPDANWEDVENTIKSINESDYYAVVRFSREAAIALAASGYTLDADYYLLDFVEEDISRQNWIALAHRHNRNRFLYVIPDADNGRSSLYTGGSK